MKRLAFDLVGNKWSLEK